ncbi:unnamed protein product [Darwinula stevensoni]|uniref:Uncharacterized protein n=1 Tax=Darwinula stevensoni TaxID=69355 RepID=A0A7R8XEC6_9CRUS|nr:unnamed protein product [Darwinula stevensoni]CAG0889548.1 unnamed protein product [Darwinula stevensoni]
MDAETFSSLIPHSPLSFLHARFSVVVACEIPRAPRVCLCAAKPHTTLLLLLLWISTLDISGEYRMCGVWMAGKGPGRQRFDKEQRRDALGASRIRDSLQCLTGREICEIRGKRDRKPAM